MKNKKILLVLLLVVAFLTSCTSKDAIKFKNEYEGLNGKTNSNGVEHRTVSIPKNNPIVYADLKEIVSMIEHEESFYVYFGSELCPWCRSVIEKAIEVANNNGIKKIYYVDFWDDEYNELYRDKYTLDDDGNPVKTNEGTKEYEKIIDYLSSVLSEYEIKNKDDEKIDLNEKRVYLPNFVYIAKGKPTRFVEGISELQEDPRQELTDEILKDEEKQFDDFFINVCDDSC